MTLSSLTHHGLQGVDVVNCIFQRTEQYLPCHLLFCNVSSPFSLLERGSNSLPLQSELALVISLTNRMWWKWCFELSRLYHKPCSICLDLLKMIRAWTLALGKQKPCYGIPKPHGEPLCRFSWSRALAELQHQELDIQHQLPAVWVSQPVHPAPWDSRWFLPPPLSDCNHIRDLK